MGAGYVRVGVQAPGVSPSKYYEQEGNKRACNVCMYCCVPGRSSDPAHERSHSRVCWLSTRFTAGPLPRNYPGAHNAVLQTPLAIASPLLFWAAHLFTYSCICSVSELSFVSVSPGTSRVRSWGPVPRARHSFEQLQICVRWSIPPPLSNMNFKVLRVVKRVLPHVFGLI